MVQNVHSENLAHLVNILCLVKNALNVRLVHTQAKLAHQTVPYAQLALTVTIVLRPDYARLVHSHHQHQPNALIAPEAIILQQDRQVVHHVLHAIIALIRLDRLKSVLLVLMLHIQAALRNA
jgi:hypothetical protein